MITSQVQPPEEVSVQPDTWFPGLEVNTWKSVYNIDHANAKGLQYAFEQGTAQVNLLLAPWRKTLKGDFPVAATKDYAEAVYAKAMAFALPLISALRQPSEVGLDEDQLGISPGEFEARASAALARVQGKWAGETGRLSAWCV